LNSVTQVLFAPAPSASICGQHTHAVLQELLHLRDDEIEALAKKGVI